MVRRLIVAAAVAVASLGANADYIYWNFKAPDGNIAGTTLNNQNATHSLYVFVSDATESDMKNPGIYTSGVYQQYGDAVKAISYTKQKPEEALSKFSSIRAGTASADMRDHQQGLKDADVLTEPSEDHPNTAQRTKH